MEKIYNFYERDIFIQDGINNGLSIDEAERQVNTLDNLNHYTFAFKCDNEKISVTTLKNFIAVPKNSLTPYEKSYYNKAFDDFYKLTMCKK